MFVWNENEHWGIPRLDRNVESGLFDIFDTTESYKLFIQLDR